MFFSFNTCNGLVPRVFCQIRKSGTTLPPSKVLHQQMMYKRTIGKPHPRVRLNPSGDITIRTDRLKKKYKWKAFEIKKLMNFLDQSALKVKNLPEIERLPALQSKLNDYIRELWGMRMAAQRATFRVNRRYRLKRRADKKVKRKLLFWQRVEDLKEQRVLRDQAREARQARGELFSFRKFLTQYKEAHRIPPIIHDDETFEKVLQKEIETKFIRGPASSRRKIYPRASYELRYSTEIVDPMVYQLKKKGFVTQFIRAHEQALRERKVAEKLAERRLIRSQEKEKKTMERQEHWKRVMGEWHEENNRLKALKMDYLLAREEIYSEARKEFLQALNNDVHMWMDTPDECRFMRFQFGEGVEFPFNATKYR